jgi:predicted RNA-binding Zn-ribbon protein involved in translation (DUF1610 family)
MSFRIVDLQCPSCKHRVLDQMCKRDVTIPCPSCGTDMTVWWGAQTLYRDRKWDAFTPVTCGFKTYSTREEWTQHQTRMRRQTGDPDFDFEGQTRVGRKTQLEEHVHTTLQQYREDGRDAHAAERRMEKYLQRGTR